ncbi:hypothetical protein ASPZODRAFT_17853 [Penicilliopsis zonata CBS 506.65]|uniref:Uncharacterized protein n=1 Tax=Penicilliopsis zonata CBS 506.65 TaxID=1073090 RepID=A0A1L9SCN5_9EURO|nr:hypothetical protein ASPZODRAFT_17853 [Penicilliopsis zonata CBS 506.65]OJJ44941.1 hypothetical protein ASPZODRAFT_17853 [Penicilliopsis zonata CBS 506.65]
MASDGSEFSVDYNEVLLQINSSLTNALNTFGPSSRQYQTILDILKGYMRNIDGEKASRDRHLNPDVLSVAMGFLEIGK